MKDKKVLGVILILLILSISVTGFSMGKDITDIDRVAIVANSNTNKREVTNVKISLNGNPLNIPTEYGAPFIDNQSRTMIPLRIIGERLGHEVGWDNATRTASIDDEVFITIGQKVVKTKNGDIQMDTVAILKNDGRTYVPLRFVVEALGYEVTYDGPKHSNNYNHMVDIYKEGMTLPTEPTQPVKDGNVYTIKGESGTVSINLDTDRKEVFGQKMGITNEKAYELLELFHKSIKVTETKNSVKVVFYQPEMPTSAGLKYNASIALGMKEDSGYGAYLTIYGTEGPNPFTTIRDDGYREVVFEIDMSKVENITFSGQVSYNGSGSEPYKADLRTGKVARGIHEYLYD